MVKIIHTHINISQRALDAFNESDHPREDDGKFGSGGGSGPDVDKVNKYLKQTGGTKNSYTLGRMQEAYPETVAAFAHVHAIKDPGARLKEITAVETKLKNSLSHMPGPVLALAKALKTQAKEDGGIGFKQLDPKAAQLARSVSATGRGGIAGKLNR